MSEADHQNFIRLPEPRHAGAISVEQALMHRRSIRTYTQEPVSLAQLSQLAWAAQGVSSPRGYRTAPSAGALYPLEIYICAGRVNGLASGVYRYDTRHALRKIVAGDHRQDLARAALNQGFIAKAPAIFLFCAVYERVTNTYGERGRRYVLMEVGHAAQNLCLQAVALGLGTAAVGAFRDDSARTIFKLAPEEQPVYIIPVGKN